jgi:cobalt ECF transporter T component CbiQ
VLAIGANCFTMAFGMPFCGYLAYRLCAGRSSENSTWRAFAAGIGGYVGLNVGALLTALLLGLQPALYHDTSGRALFFPFGLKVTVPAIMAAHLLVAGVAEAVVTALAVRYVQRLGIPLYGMKDAGQRGGRIDLLWAGLCALAALAPLGLLASGEVWGEWSNKDLAKLAGYLPAGWAAVEESSWKGFSALPDYLSDRGALGYVVAAVFGILLIAAVVFAVGRLLMHRPARCIDPPDHASPMPAVRPGPIPAWMLSDWEKECSLPDVKRGRTRGNYVAKTLARLAEGGRETLFAERWALKPGLLQRLDPRAKILVLLGFVVVTSFLRHPGLVVALYLLSLALGVLSGLPVLLMLKRVWLAVAVFAGVVTLPAALSVVTPGPAFVVLWSDPYIAVTQPGVVAAGILTLRVAVAVSFVALLTLTTRWSDLLSGLRVLLVPKLFLNVLLMTYRYLGVLMQSAADMFVARRSRTIGPIRAADSRRFVGSTVGGLFGKTLALTDEVHAAMISRGWSGEARALRPLALERADMIWMVAMTGLGVAAVRLEVLWR